jgi:glycosyltransferase involved in cell wall biosynthesis
MAGPLTVLCAAKLHANQLERHLEVIERCPLVGRIIVVRHAPLPLRLSKLENVSLGKGSVPLSALRMYTAVQALITKARVDWVLGFNPVPWGSVALAAARNQPVKTCLSLIGRDYQQVQSAWGWPFRRALQLATAVTVTGGLMVDGLVRIGVDASRLHVLPHSVDLERFTPATDEPAFDVLTVGQLIRRKRMDVLVQAIAILRDMGVRVTLGILGRGPEEPRLRTQVAKAGISDRVTFLGYRDDVEAVLRQARMFALVSEWEGVPFALMEAMAAGVVPVVTGVGTIRDWVSPDSNGVIVPVGDAKTLAQRLARLLLPGSSEVETMRGRLLAERQRLSFDAGVAVWTKIFSSAGAAN